MKHLIFLAFAGAMLHAQTASISDTITTPFGGTFSGTITVTLNNPATAQPLYSGSTTLTGWSNTYTVTAGAFTATLYANDQITPTGTSYTARYTPASGSSYSETWVVPTGATTIRELRSTTVPTPRTMFTPSQITQAGAMLGQGLTWDGSKWAPAAVLINPMTATGDLITRNGGVPVRVGIGSTGQVLTVAGGLPTWASGISGNAATATALAAALTSGRVLLGNGTGIPATDAGLEYDPLAGGLGRLRLTNSAANTGLWISQTGEGRALNILANGPATSLGQVVVDSQTATSGGVLWVGASGSGFTNTTTGAAYVWVSSASASGNALMVRNAGSGTALTLKNDLNSRLAFLDGSTNTTESAVVGSFNALTTGQAISVASSNNGFSASSGLIRANVAGATSTGNAFVADMSGTGTAFRANTSKGFGLDVQSSSSTAAAARIFTSGQGNNDALSVVVYNAPSGTGKAFSVYGGVNGGSLNAWIDSTGGASFSGSVAATSFVGPLTGNAATATALQTARTIAGVSFNGTANIAIPSTGLSDSSDIVRGGAAVATGQVLYGTGAGVAGTEAAFAWSTAGNVKTLVLADGSSQGSAGNLFVNWAGGQPKFRIGATNNTLPSMQFFTAAGAESFYILNAGPWRLWDSGSSGIAFGTNNVERARFAATTGNLLLNSTVDDGTNRLQVAGNMAATGVVRSTQAGRAQLTGANARGALELTDSAGLNGLNTYFNGSSWKLESASNLIANIPTWLLNNETPTTGVTQLIVRAGAGQGSTNLTTWQNAAGTALSAILPTGQLRFIGVTVASLPAAAAGNAGAIATVTDANATTIGTTVAGGGANTVLVWSNGTNWRIYAN